MRQVVVHTGGGGNDGRESLYKVLAVLVSLVIVGLVVWWVGQVLGDLIRYGILVVMFFVNLFVLRLKRSIVKPGDEGILNRQRLTKGLAIYGIKIESPEDASQDPKIVAVLMLYALAFLALYGSLGTAFWSFAADPKFQIVPVNILGFLAITSVVAVLFSIVQSFFTEVREINEVATPAGLRTYLLSKLATLIVQAYIIAILLITFGLIK